MGLSVELRNSGTMAPYSPIMKRGTGVTSTDQHIMVVPDTNRTAAQGSNQGGTARFNVYVSTDASRTVYNSFLITPTVAPSSAIQSAVCSVMVRNNNDLLIAYQGTDESVNLITATWTTNTYTAFTEQQIIASSAVEGRIRAIDIDVLTNDQSVAVAIYEAAAATGQGAWARLYIRRLDGTTWIKAWEDHIFTSEFIMAGSEDISVAWENGVTASLTQLAVYYTRTHTAGDNGDRIVEVELNYSTVTALGAVELGSWFTNLNQNQASGSRRGWLFSEGSNVWMFATAVGTRRPFFMSCRLYHAQFTNIIQNRSATFVSSLPVVVVPVFLPNGTPVFTSGSFGMIRDGFPGGYVTCAFSNAVVAFGYAGLGFRAKTVTQMMVMSYSTVTSNATAKAIDQAPRMLDGAYTLEDGVIGVYGGGNSRLTNPRYNFVAMYGKSGDLSPALVSDTFNRTVAAGGLGVPNSGGAYVISGGANSDFAVTNSEAQVTLTSVTVARSGILTVGVGDLDVVADFKTSVLMTGGVGEFGVVGRWRNAGNDYYMLRALFKVDQTIDLVILKRVAGVETSIAGPTVVAGLAHSTGNRFRLKLTMNGTAISGKVWGAENTEPVGSTVSVVDSSLLTVNGGDAGFRVSRNAANTNVNLVAAIDNLTFFPPNTISPIRSRRVRAICENTPSSPTVLSPDGSTVSNNLPTIRVQMQNVDLYSNELGKVRVQVATNSTFTTNLRTFEQDDSAFVSLSTTTGTTPPVRTVSVPVPAASALFPGTWFCRALVVHDLGGVSAFSATVSFAIAHPPTAVPLAPAPGSTMLYGTGDVPFSWKYSDTEASDTQSAYQVIVTRVDNGTVVWDSGKVFSSLGSVSNNFSATLKDIPLQWSVALWDSYDSKGPSSNPVLFTVTDPPTVAVTSPTQAGIVTTALPTITWSFTVGGIRTQRAYRVFIYDRDLIPDLLVADTGWRMGAETNYTFPAQILQQSDINAFTADFETGVAGWVPNFSTIAQNAAAFHSGTKSAILTVVGTPAQAYARPGFFAVTPGDWYQGTLWVHCVAGYANVSAAIDWFDANDVYINSSGPAGTALAANTWEQRAVLQAQAPVNAVKAVFGPTIGGNPPTSTAVSFDDVKFDALNYQVYVQVQDSIGLQAEDNKLFSTDWVEPVQAAATVTSDAFKVTVAWTNAAVEAGFVAWRVYRRYMIPAIVDLDLQNTASLWTLLYETTTNKASYTFQDYLAPLNRPVEYAVVQMADRFGSLIESKITSSSTVTLVGDRYYFVPEVPIGSIAAFEAAYVTAEGFSKEVEQALLHIKGRGRQLQIGDDLGYTGTLTIKLRNAATARRDREFFEFLSSDDAGNVYMRNPFGDVLYIGLGNVQTNRIEGVGNSDLVDLSIPYFVVASNLPITRSS